MSKRRKAGDWVKLVPNVGFVGESDRLLAEIRPEDDGATVVIGGTEYAATRRAQPNRSRPIDLGDWVLPTHRPVTPWW